MVRDMNIFKNFLKKHLKVPEKNIISLQDGWASCKEIISSFKHLKDNKDYKKDKVGIIIFYAGHGTWNKIPKEWQNFWFTSNGFIEMLCPSDIGSPNPNINSKKVEGIPDQMISALLNQISEAKGNNIISILNFFHN